MNSTTTPSVDKARVAEALCSQAGNTNMVIEHLAGPTAVTIFTNQSIITHGESNRRLGGMVTGLISL